MMTREDAAAAVARMNRRGAAPSPIAAAKPPAELFAKPATQPFAPGIRREVPPPELFGRGNRPAPAEPGPFTRDTAHEAVRRMNRRREARLAEAMAAHAQGAELPDPASLPVTADLASRPEWAELVKAEPLTLASVETWFKQAAGELGPQFQGGLAVDEIGQIAYREMIGEELSAADRATLAAGLSTPAAATVPGAAANLLGSSLLTLGEGVKGALIGAVGGAGAATAISGGALAPAGAAVGAGFGAAVAASQRSYRTIAGLAWVEFGEFRDATGQGLDPDVRRAAAGLAGLLGAGLETFGLGFLASKFPGLSSLGAAGSRDLVKRLLTRPGFAAALGKAAKGWASGVAVETSTEVGQELVQIAMGELAKLADSGEFAAASGEDILHRLEDTAWQTARGMALLAFPGPAASFAVDLRRAARAEKQAKVYQALGEVAGKVNGKTPPAQVAAWVEAVQEQAGGPVEAVFVDGEAFRTFFQEAGADPAAVAAELGVANEYAQALTNGGDVAVPLSVWTAKVAATPAHQGLADHVRLTPDAMTTAEARQYALDIEELAKGAASGEQTPAARVLEDVARQLEAGGRPADVAQLEAALLAAFFPTMGERAGGDAWQLYQDQKLEVRRVLPEGLQGMDDAELDSILGREREPENEQGAALETPNLETRGLEALRGGDLEALAEVVQALEAQGVDVPGLFAARLSAQGRPAPGNDSLQADETTPAPVKPVDRAYLPDGQAVDVAFEVVELAELIASNTVDLQPNPAFPAALQPRDRTRAASGEQVARMAGGLVPELLGRSANVSDGAPIVGPDGVVESGNGRVLALGRAYSAGMASAERYRAWLEDQGHQVGGMTAPVLIRRRQTEMDDGQREAFARAANVRTTASMSAAEQARADAAALSPELLAMIRSNDIDAASNRPFASRFLGSVASGSELGQLVDGSGKLSLDGRRRIRGALLARAYGDIALVEKLLEEDEGGLGPLGRALLDAAPEWARLGDQESTAALLEAVRAVVRQRDSKNPLHFALEQGDALGGGLSVDGRAFLASFLNRDAKGRSRLLSRVRLTKLLEAVADEVARHDDGGISLLGETSRPSVGQMVAAVDKRARRELVETLAELGLDPATATAADIAAAAPDRTGTGTGRQDAVSGRRGCRPLRAGAARL